MLADNGETVHRLTRGRPRTDPRLRRTQIIQAAESIFVRDGYAHATMEHVAAECLISKATLYAAFPNKKDLFAAVVQAGTCLNIPDNASGEMTVVQMLEAMLMPASDGHALGDRATVLRILCDEAHEIAELRDIFRAAIETECQKLGDWLNVQQSDGNIYVEDAADAARMLINAAMDHSAYHPDTVGDAAARSNYIQHCISLFSRGITPRVDC